jgi:hypothetical protein
MLHLNKLADFTIWLEAHGWEREANNTVACEALRMKRNGLTLLVHKKDSATQHLTTWGVSHAQLLMWLKETRR